MPSSELLDHLAAAALLGAERSGPPPAPSEEPLAAFAARLNPAQREHVLLSLAAAANVFYRAGSVPAEITTTLAPAPADDAPPVSETSAQHLTLMLAGHHVEVLPEYFSLVAKSGRSLPARHLPELLSTATRDDALRPLILPVIGARGRWLANLNPDWQTFGAPLTEEHYHTGTPAQRLALLNQLRRSNPQLQQSSPATARELVAATWDQEKPDDRAAFLQTFAVGLTMEDEPFLESALNDKRNGVREVAVELLARLPDSRLSQRMAARLKPLVNTSKKLLGKAKLVITIPETHTKDMARDGIDAKSQIPGLGDKAAHLAVIIAATPLIFWAQKFQADFPALFKQIDAAEWKDAIYFGLAVAAVHKKNTEFAAALLRHWSPELSDTEVRQQSHHVTSLMAVLSPPQCESVVLPLLSNKSFFDRDILLTLLLACRHAWSQAFSEKFIPLLWRYAEFGNSYHPSNHALSKVFGLYAHPSILAAAQSHLAANDSVRSNHLDHFLGTLQFRHNVQKEFQS